MNGKFVCRESLFRTLKMENSLLIAILSPVLITCGGLISWFLKSKKDELINAEERAREFKINTYRKLLEPFIAAFTVSISDEERNREIEKLQSLEYKRAIVDLTTFGSDQTLKTFNKIIQSFYQSDEYRTDPETWDKYTVKLLALISEFLLEIRRDVYSKKTRLVRSELIESILKDIDQYKTRINAAKI